MLRQTLVLGPALLLALTACKARTDAASSVKEGGDAAPTSGGADQLFARFEIDMDATERLYGVVAGGEDQSKYENFALADANTMDALRSMSARLKQLSRETPQAKRQPVEAVAIEIEAMALLVEGNLPGATDDRINAALARARAVLGDKGQGAQANTGAAPTQPTTPSQPQTDYNVLDCVSSGDSYIPQVHGAGINIGYVGFSQYNNCTLVASNARNGIACGLYDSNYVSAFRTRSNELIGPAVGFNHTKNCVNAVKASNNEFICLVDNRPGVSKYAKYSVTNGQALDYWFDTLDKCLHSDKSPDPREQCINNCKADNDRCKKNAERYPRMDQTSKRLDCIQKALDCTEACG